ncbi:MAG: redoxin domain-containing protein [Promethearchaeota archaeon]
MGKNKIKIGVEAPSFKIKSYNVGTIDLSDLIGKQKIILIFSRYFGCPICHLELLELIEKLPEIEKKGVKILYITQSGEDIAQEFIEKYNITFPIIPSSKDKLYKEYGLGLMTMSALTKVPGKLKAAKKKGIIHGKYEGWEKQCPGQFVIDENGIIIYAKKGWLDINSILKVL